ncbi:MAG: phenylalanine--tRNA ligase subunit beta, partial [Clostridia bacterium]
VGIRPINNLVDVTNYVLVEIGQPMHAFDQKLLDNKQIIIRRANEREEIVALDGKKYELNNDNLVICDAKKPIAVAGIMGGEYSSICETTNTVILESAKFVRDSIRHTSRNLNLKSDSSARFEKGIDYVSQEMGLNRALALFDEYNWGDIVDGKIDILDKEYADQDFVYNYKEVNKVIGADIPKSTIMDILNSLTLKTTDKGDILTTVIPNYREDIVAINDIAEEIIRLYGYDIVKPRMVYSTQGGKTEIQLRYDKIKQFMVGNGAFEILTYSFVSKKAFDLLNLSANSNLRNVIELANPLGADFSVMRTTIAYSMIKTIANNYVRGNKEGRLFEIAKTYIPKSLPLTELPIEENKLSIGLFGEKEDYYCLKSIIDDLAVKFGIEIDYERVDIEYLHPGRSAKILASGKQIGILGEVHPDVIENFGLSQKIYIAEIDIEYFANNGTDIKPYKAVSKYQAMERDLALVTPKNMPVTKLLKTIKNVCSNLLESANVFDVYEGGSLATLVKKSVAIKLVFRDLNRTLVDSDVNTEIENVLSDLKKIDVCLR